MRRNNESLCVQYGSRRALTCSQDMLGCECVNKHEMSHYNLFTENKNDLLLIQKYLLAVLWRF